MIPCRGKGKRNGQESEDQVGGFLDAMSRGVESVLWAGGGSE